MFIDVEHKQPPCGTTCGAAVRRSMFIDVEHKATALRQEGYVHHICAIVD
jgi:hypothetical protein